MIHKVSEIGTESALSDTNPAPANPAQKRPAAVTQRVTDRNCPKPTACRKRISRHARREELAIANLLVFPSIDQAATATRISERTLRRWLAQPAFAARFRTAKHTLLERVTDRLLRGSDECAATLIQLATDRKVPATARVRACVKSVELAIKTVQIAQIEERLSQVEAALQRRRAL